MSCPTGKKGFPNPTTAAAALRTIKIKGAERDDRPVRHYRCEDCGEWHLTSARSDDRKKGSGRRSKRTRSRRRWRAGR